MSSVPRFFVPLGAVNGETITLPADAAHHAVGVLRLRSGDALTVHDGENRAYDCLLEDGATTKRAMARVRARRELDTEPRVRVTVAQALPKTSDKIEQVLQHGTEIGAAHFVFFAAFRSVARLADGEKIDKRLVRWQGIIQGAAEQSGRGVMPTVAWLPFAPDVAKTWGEYAARLVLHEKAQTSFRDTVYNSPASEQELIVVIGPEGGFTDEEITLFETAGAVTTSLGPRVLRTETASLVALTLLLEAKDHGKVR